MTSELTQVGNVVNINLDPVVVSAGIGVAIEAANLISEKVVNNARKMPKEILAKAIEEPLIGKLEKRDHLNVVAQHNYSKETGRDGLKNKLNIEIDKKRLKSEGRKPSTLASISNQPTEILTDELSVPSGRYAFYSNRREESQRVVGYYFDHESSPEWILGLTKNQSNLNPVNPVVMADGQVVYSAKPKNKYFNVETPSSALYVDQIPIPVGPITFSYSRFGKTQDGMAFMIAYPEGQKNTLSCFLIDTKAYLKQGQHNTFLKGGFERFDLDMNKILKSSGLTKAETIRATPWFQDNNVQWLIEISSSNEKDPKIVDEHIIVATKYKSGDIKYQDLSDLLVSKMKISETKPNIKIIDIVEYTEKGDKRNKRVLVGLVFSKNGNNNKFLLLDEEGKALVVDKQIKGDFIKTIKPTQASLLDQTIKSVAISTHDSEQKVSIPKFASNAQIIL